jgi:hypothetical protein
MYPGCTDCPRATQCSSGTVTSVALANRVATPDQRRLDMNTNDIITGQDWLMVTGLLSVQCTLN